MRLTAYDQITLFEELQPEWNELLGRSTSDRIFSTWEWQKTWWEAYHPGELWVIECRDDTHRLVGLAPWFIENHPVHGRVVRSIGCIEVTDYLDLIVDAGCIDAVMAQFAAFLAENRHRYDVVDLCNLPETSPTYQLFPDILTQHGFHVAVSVQEVCPVINLPETWEAYLESLDKKQRHEVRRKMRRAEGGDEKVGWYTVGETHNLEAEIDRFLTLMASSHSQKGVFLQDTQNVAFFRAVVPLVFRKNWLQLSFLTVNGQAVASYLNFVYRDRVLVYNSGLLPQEYGHLSPGIVLLAYNIRWAIENRYQVFDFLRGNEAYKYRMGGKDTRIYMLRAT